MIAFHFKRDGYWLPELEMTPAFAATSYYVRADCGDGGDGTTNTCGGGTGAWNEISDVNAKNFADNDTVNLRAGDTWAETLTLSGSDGNETGITVQGSDFGGQSEAVDGLAAFNGDVAQPVNIDDVFVNLTLKDFRIDGEDWDVNSKSSNLRVRSVNGLTIDGVEGIGGGSTDKGKTAISLGASGKPVIGNIVVKNTVISAFYKGATNPHPTDDTDHIGIAVLYKVDGGTVNIFDNTVYDIGGDNIQIYLSTSTTNIYSNTIYNWAENAIDVKGSDNVNIYRNYIYRSSFTGCNGGSGERCPAINLLAADGGSPGTVKVYENHFKDHDNWILQSSRNNADQDDRGTNEFYLNWIEDSKYGVRIQYGETDLRIHNNKWEFTGGYTYSSGDTDGNAGIFLNLFSNNDTATSVLLYNNTIYFSGDVGDNLSLIDVNDGDMTMKNNYFEIDDSDDLILTESTDQNIDMDYNVYFNSNGGNQNIITWNGTTYDESELASWQAAEGGANSNFADCDIAADMTLNEGSNCIDVGVDLGAAYDDALDPATSFGDGVTVTTGDQDDYGPPGQATLQAEPDAEDLNPTLETNAYVQPTAGAQSWDIGAYLASKDHSYTIWRLSEGDGVGDECDPTPTWTWETKSYTDLLSHVFSGLSVSTIYCWQAVFGNVAGDGTASAIDEFTTTGSSAGTKITTSSAGAKNVTITVSGAGSKTVTITIRP
jgi:hypothetical protein